MSYLTNRSATLFLLGCISTVVSQHAQATDDNFLRQLEANRAAAAQAHRDAEQEMLAWDAAIEAYRAKKLELSSTAVNGDAQMAQHSLTEESVPRQIAAGNQLKPSPTTPIKEAEKKAAKKEKPDSESTEETDAGVKAEIDEEDKSFIAEGNWGPIYSENSYFATFHVGSTLMAEYDESGNNDGFSETNLFGRFNLDNRLPLGKKGAPTSYIHTGVNVDFFSGHVTDCEKLSPEEGEDGDQNSDNNTPQQNSQEACEDQDLDLSDVDFNDISDTVHASLYAWWQWRPDFILADENPGWEWGPGIRATIQSRDKLDDNGDSINEIYSLGWRVMYHDYQVQFNESSKENMGFRNGLPIFFLETSYADYENFAGVEDSKRWLISGAYRIFEQSPVYMGMVVNAGEGPDEIALTLSYGIDVSKIGDLLNVGSK